MQGFAIGQPRFTWKWPLKRYDIVCVYALQFTELIYNMIQLLLILFTLD